MTRGSRGIFRSAHTAPILIAVTITLSAAKVLVGAAKNWRLAATCKMLITRRKLTANLDRRLRKTFGYGSPTARR
jgi:hypothetical protein